MNNTGYKLASILSQAIRQAQYVPKDVPFATIETFAYDFVQSLADVQILGDWLETPNGTTYALTFKPEKKTS